MGKALIGIIALVVGLIIGVAFGGAMTGGAAAGIGVATGLSAGICSTVTAAQEEGLLTAEQVAQVLTRAATDMGAEVPDGTGLVNSADECAGIMEKLRSVAAE
ncbi:hypothetical protein KUV26_22660 [Leisingera daeponensis]|uniref:Uncharacterized protein n=1 Tax=Leisingera daeponensis TaxID=405746 RepID=A0ABS7NM04_9RHOB|nr:hypothetical protein [Leisingera daeponensis]MBY6142238.1 hypothetical protein [Leisingera daeponensis]